jgi:Uma2 family endonuclease
MTEYLRNPSLPRFDNAQEWHDSLGDVPLHRIIFNPLPGTATEADLIAFVDGDSKRFCELIDGTLVEKPLGMDESLIAAAIIHMLRSFVKPRKLGVISGEAGMTRMTSSNRIRMPDVGFFSTRQLEQIPTPRPKVWKVSPELAVEVLSDGNTEAEMKQKRTEYFASGTRLVWVVDPVRRTVAVYTSPDPHDHLFSENEMLDGGDVLPGFSAAVKEFFEDIHYPQV